MANFSAIPKAGISVRFFWLVFKDSFDHGVSRTTFHNWIVKGENVKLQSHRDALARALNAIEICTATGHLPLPTNTKREERLAKFKEIVSNCYNFAA